MDQLNAKAADNFSLFLWSTFPTLEETFQMMAQTDLRYATTAFVWVKVTKTGVPHLGMGYYTRANAEPCLLFKGGRGLGRSVDRSINSVVLAPRGRHSAKPMEVKYRIMRMYPYAKRLELFARDRLEGWDVWGNEV